MRPKLKTFLASCALAPGFDQRDFTARRLGELLSGNREWALKTCLSWVEDISHLLYCVRACFPVKKTPRKSYPAMTLLFILAILLPQHLTFDLTLGLQAIKKVNCTKDVMRTAWDWRYEIAIMSTRPIHKNLFMEILKKARQFCIFCW